ncbi:MAG: EamA family transporter RarD [Caldilineaceae bacterium]|nr:EamA family transporter RarD [Caldilineaceae bacterium]
MSRGALYALSCYIIWGFLPIYWKFLSAIPGLETTSHRVIWSAVVAALVLIWQRNWRWLGDVLRQPRVILTFAATAILILANWLIYIYAINNDQIVESSLGYFINPLVNVLLGIIFLRERPRLWQWIAIAVAAAGVTYLTIDYGRLPWVALGLAGSFAFYALLKKTATLPALEGLFLETTFLAIPLTIYLFSLDQSGQGTFGMGNWQTSLLLILGGPLTALPLLLFSAGAKRVSMTLLGLLQYIAPTMQFVIGIALYHEPFSQSQLVGFAFIWVALVLFTLESTAERRRLQLALRAR